MEFCIAALLSWHLVERRDLLWTTSERTQKRHRDTRIRTSLPFNVLRFERRATTCKRPFRGDSCSRKGLSRQRRDCNAGAWCNLSIDSHSKIWLCEMDRDVNEGKSVGASSVIREIWLSLITSCCSDLIAIKMIHVLAPTTLKGPDIKLRSSFLVGCNVD